MNLSRPRTARNRTDDPACKRLHEVGSFYCEVIVEVVAMPIPPLPLKTFRGQECTNSSICPFRDNLKETRRT